MADSTVTLQWSEPISHFGVSDALVDEAIKRGVRDHLLEDKEFRALIKQAITTAGETISKEAMYESVKNAVSDILREKIAAQRKELEKCMADFQSMKTMHASEYANRRFLELKAKLDELDQM